MQQLRKTKLKKFLKNSRYDLNDIVLILDCLSYAQNVAQLFRIADAMGVKKIYLTGCTPMPPFGKTLKKVSRSKEDKIPWEYSERFSDIYTKLIRQDYKIIALEITDEARDIYQMRPSDKIALILGNEAHGISPKTLEKADICYFIPMQGKGSSLNVAVAGAIALSHIVRNSNDISK